MTLVNANARPQVTGQDELPGKSHHFIGNDPVKWRTNIPNYAKVKYEGVYPGVDLVYYGNQRQLEYDFVVAPGADPGSVTLAFKGATDVHIDARGELVLKFEGGELRQHRPVVYQEVAGVRQEIAGRYVTKGKQQVGFAVGSYDASLPLVIDPTLVYSTYLGGSGSGFDNGTKIAVDTSGHAYVTGFTDSSDFPTMAGAVDTTLDGSTDAFVTKLDPTGTALVYSTYFGGSGYDYAYGIAVDSLGNAYVTGLTSSTTGSNNFPTTAGAFDTSFDGPYDDAFVTKLNPAGSALVYSTYLGGNSPSDQDQGLGITVDASFNAYVAGSTFATNFPTTPGAFQAARAGSFDSFVTKLNPAGSALVYSTYLGGSSFDFAYGIAVDAGGDVYVTGNTGSPAYPTTNAYQATLPSGSSAFVTRLNAVGTALVYSTYLGGTSFQTGQAIAVDSAGSAYVAGATTSTTFPTTPGAVQTTVGGSSDAFVTKLDTNLSGPSSLVYSTYLGGGGSDSAYGIVLDSAGSAYVIGQTASTNFPITPGAFQTTYGGGSSDAFVTKLNPTGSALVGSTFLGGSSGEFGRGIALDSAGDAYVIGRTSSTDFPTTPGAFNTSYNGGQSDVFVAKISFIGPPAFLVLNPAASTNIVNTQQCVTAAVQDASGHPTPDITIRFSVVGAIATSGSTTADGNGQAAFCYDGPTTPGADGITAYADADNNNAQDPGEPGGAATTTWVAGAPATLTLSPATASNPVNTQHCVTATVQDAFANPTSGATLRFSVTGAVNISGSAATNASGQAAFCYTGPNVAGADAITAFADTDTNGSQDAGEPSGAATKTWFVPLPTAKDQCKNGGWKTFGVFKNQGDCVSFVATQGKNPPSLP